MSIPQNLRQLRIDCGLTQEQAAEKLHIARQTLSSYESGRTRPDVEMLVRLSEVYGVDLDTVLYGAGKTLRVRKRLYTAAVVLLVFLVGLTLAASVLRWEANYFFPVPEGQLTQAERELWETRVRLVEAGELLEGIVLLASRWGFAALLLGKQLWKCAVSGSARLKYTAALASGMALASLPFAAADPVFTAADYGLVLIFAMGQLALFLILDAVIGRAVNWQKRKAEKLSAPVSQTANKNADGS